LNKSSSGAKSLTKRLPDLAASAVKKRAHTVRGAKILLGITGGIAAYKSAYLVRQLTRAGAIVRVVMTRAATEFVTPLTFSALSGSPVAVDLWAKDQSTDTKVGTKHISLATWCDLMLIAPASANTLAKVSNGYADNLLTVLALACRKPVVLAPTMDADMYVNDVTQQNISRLRDRGYTIIPPDEGEHASGLLGPGRLPEVETLLKAVSDVLTGSDQDLSGKKIVVSAGPTREAIDPVRYIGNHSSGKMGYAIAREAARRGASVTLVSGPVGLETPRHVKRVDVVSADDMLTALKKETKTCDALVMSAAVADYAPVRAAKLKLKKNDSELAVELRRTPDILAAISGSKTRPRVVVGFALETDNGEANARTKLKNKSLDLVVLNEYTSKNPVFGSDRNTVTLIPRSGKATRYGPRPKTEVAAIVLDAVRDMF